LQSFVPKHKMVKKM